MTKKEKVVATMKELSEVLEELRSNPNSGWYYEELVKLNKVNTATEGLTAGDYQYLRWTLDSHALNLVLKILQED